MRISRIESYRDSQGNLVDEIVVDRSDYERVLVRRLDEDTLKLVAEDADGEITSTTLDIEPRQFVGVTSEEGGERTDIPDDLQDVLLCLGYTMTPSWLAEEDTTND